MLPKFILKIKECTRNVLSFKYKYTNENNVRFVLQIMFKISGKLLAAITNSILNYLVCSFQQGGRIA